MPPHTVVVASALAAASTTTLAAPWVMVRVQRPSSSMTPDTYPPARTWLSAALQSLYVSTTGTALVSTTTGSSVATVWPEPGFGSSGATAVGSTGSGALEEVVPDADVDEASPDAAVPGQPRVMTYPPAAAPHAASATSATIHRRPLDISAFLPARARAASEVGSPRDRGYRRARRPAGCPRPFGALAAARRP